MENAKPVEKGRLRKFSIMSVGVGQKEIDEFSVGSHITFHDWYTGMKGSGTIYSFAQAGYDPLCWYNEGGTGTLKCVHLGWCSLG